MKWFSPWNIEEWDYPFSEFDLVVSRLAFHYIQDLEKALAGIHRALRDSGPLIFSVEHPVITSSDQSRQGSGKSGYGGHNGHIVTPKFLNPGDVATVAIGGICEASLTFT